jgi:hypothetical protein
MAEDDEGVAERGEILLGTEFWDGERTEAIHGEEGSSFKNDR